MAPALYYTNIDTNTMFECTTRAMYITAQKMTGKNSSKYIVYSGN